MTEPFTLSAFVADPENRLGKIERRHLEAIFEEIAAAERPRSLRTFFWLVLRTLRSRPELYASIIEHWLPSEADLAQLLEDVGESATKTVLSLDGVLDEHQRLWKLSDEVGLSNLVKSSEPAESPWKTLSLAPQAALFTERQLDELIAAVSRGRKWREPGEVLSGEDGEFDIEGLICLAQARMVEGGWGEALNVAMLRLLAYADGVEGKH